MQFEANMDILFSMNYHISLDVEPVGYIFEFWRPFYFLNRMFYPKYNTKNMIPLLSAVQIIVNKMNNKPQ